MKAEIDNMHVIFLLKKNIRDDIIKTILGYLPIIAPESLKEWKVAITLVEQGYESTKDRQDYKTESGIIYRGRGVSVDFGKSRNNYNNDRKPRCFNCNVYRHIANNFRKLKKEKETRKYYKYNKVEYLAKNCRSEQNIKNRNIQEELDNEDNNKEKGFVGDSEQGQYNKPMYIVIL